MMWGSDYGDGGWAMMIGPIILSMLFIATVVIGVLWAIRTQRAITGAGTTAQAILNARFARGEIDESELMQRRRQLNP